MLVKCSKNWYLVAMDMRVIKQEDIQTVLDFEMELLEGRFDDEMEKELYSWKAPWRREALEHYLSIGWSFAVWDSGPEQRSGDLLGYVLCQPLLFYKGFTQTLWVEHLSAPNEKVLDQLVEVVYRWSRDKHLQKLVIPKVNSHFLNGLTSEKFDDDRLVVNTAKIR